MDAESRFSYSELFVTAGGLASSIAVVHANALIAHWLGLNVLSFSFWLVIPGGAILGGALAASGYYFTAVWTHTMPSRRFLFDVAVVGASTWFYSLWLEYQAQTFSNGIPISSTVSLWEYFKYATEHQHLSLGRRGADTGALGMLGYLRELVQLLGFTGGGVWIWFVLGSRDKCATCPKYVRIKRVLKSVPREQLAGALAGADLTLLGVEGEVHAAQASQRVLGLDLSVMQCPQCDARWVRAALVVPSGSSTVRKNLKRHAISPEQWTALGVSAKAT